MQTPYEMEVNLEDGLKGIELPEKRKTTLLDEFSEFFAEAEQYKDKALSIVVTSVDDVEKIEEASTIRKALKKIRVSAEKKRKELKAGIVREGKAIDGMGNIVKALIVPLEEHLLEQEKFAERLEAERIEKLKAERQSALAPYVEDPSVFPLDTMPEEAFEQLLEAQKAAHELKQQKAEQAAKAAAEAEQAAKEEKLRLEREAAVARAKAQEEREAREAAERKAQEEREAAEKAIQEERRQTRLEAVKPFLLPDTDLSMFDYGTMSQDSFSAHLYTLKAAYEEAQAAKIPATKPLTAVQSGVVKAGNPTVDNDALMNLCKELCDVDNGHRFAGKPDALYFEIMGLIG